MGAFELSARNLRSQLVECMLVNFPILERLLKCPKSLFSVVFCRAIGGMARLRSVRVACRELYTSWVVRLRFLVVLLASFTTLSLCELSCEIGFTNTCDRASRGRQVLVSWCSTYVSSKRVLLGTYGVMGMLDRCREPRAAAVLGVASAPDVPLSPFIPLLESLAAIRRRNCSLFMSAASEHCDCSNPAVRTTGSPGGRHQYHKLM